MGSASDREPPALAATARQFGDHARQYAVSRAHIEGASRELLLERMEPVSDEVLLDVGSGPGPVALAFAGIGILAEAMLRLAAYVLAGSSRCE